MDKDERCSTFVCLLPPEEKCIATITHEKQEPTGGFQICQVCPKTAAKVTLMHNLELMS